jgi:hypothetical protein
METMSILITLVGVIIIPWMSSNEVQQLRDEEEKYEEEHKEELW